MIASTDHPRRRGFSLIEVLMAVFILGVGVISIAALFPAGIAQQRQSVDDILGPVVADNALSVLRSKLRPEDFGSFEQFSPADASLAAPRRTIPGDWTWLRPSFIFASGNEEGAIDIFSYDRTVDDITTERAWEFSPPAYSGAGYSDFDGDASVPALYGIPYNVDRYRPAPAFTPEPPRIVFTQNERYYPQLLEDPDTLVPPRPQYMWDCMFRRFQGRILVAIFVYRVNQPGGEQAEYRVSANQSNPSVPPLPIWLELTAATAPSMYSADGPWDATGPNDPPGTGSSDNGLRGGDDNIVWGFPGAPADFDLRNETQSWQATAQWLLSQNNDVHRVVSNSRENDSEPVRVELARPADPKPFIPVYYFAGGVQAISVTDIWYLPVVDANDNRLTPVYATVKEL